MSSIAVYRKKTQTWGGGNYLLFSFLQHRQRLYHRRGNWISKAMVEGEAHLLTVVSRRGGRDTGKSDVTGFGEGEEEGRKTKRTPSGGGMEA